MFSELKFCKSIRKEFEKISGDSTTSKALWIEVYKAFLFERLLNKMMFLKIIKTQKAELINQINLSLFEKGVYFINVMENNQSVYRGNIIKE